MEVEVRGYKNFNETLHLLQDDGLKKRLEDTIKSLKNDNNGGDKIVKKLFPKSYERKYGISNLFRYEIGSHRLLYTITVQSNKKTYLLIDFLNHSEYDKLFGYNTS